MKKVNIEMLVKTTTQGNIPLPSKTGERLRVNVIDKSSYLNFNVTKTVDYLSNTIDPLTIEYTEVTLIAIPYVRGNERWLEWELLL